MEKINIAIDTNKDSFLIDISVDNVELVSKEGNEKDIKFIEKLKNIIKEYGY